LIDWNNAVNKVHAREEIKNGELMITFVGIHGDNLPNVTYEN
jgi:hypothetical protein